MGRSAYSAASPTVPNAGPGWAGPFEEELCAKLFEAPDAKEGRHAFLEKRKPRFQDL